MLLNSVIFMYFDTFLLNICVLNPKKEPNISLLFITEYLFSSPQKQQLFWPLVAESLFLVEENLNHGTLWIVEFSVFNCN